MSGRAPPMWGDIPSDSDHCIQSIRALKERQAPVLELEFASTNLAVRDALQRVHDRLLALGADAHLSDHVQIVLGELLNNVVEHAFAESSSGRIELELFGPKPAIALCVRDNGAPMPGGKIPDGKLPEIPDDMKGLPEGGFGWNLIRTLCDCVCYRRTGGLNEISLLVGNEEEAAGVPSPCNEGASP
ncbi:MAG: ATP-binding protein [Alphaproteobacteria bacterium]|nr:MAG: ATP-binding protein [Alphaproteobacteria bacterium]